MSTCVAANLKASDGTTPQAELGQEFHTKYGAVWTYVQASGAVAAYQLVHITAAGLAIESTTTLVGTAARPTQLGVAQYAIASGEYGWVARKFPRGLREDGSTTFKVNAALNCATSVKLYTTATAGVVDDTATTGVVQGLALTETITTAEAADCAAVTMLTSFCDT